jgi:hypothetical protein
MVALEKILLSSALYKDYFNKDRSSKRMSIAVAELDIDQKSKLPQ